MSTSTLPSRPVVVSGPEIDYIESTIDQTGAQLRSHDAGLALIRIVAGALLFLLVMICVDHWLFDLTVFGRAAGLLLGLAGITYGIVVYLMPPIARRINP